MWHCPKATKGEPAVDPALPDDRNANRTDGGYF
jgi:hypothetical protein